MSDTPIDIAAALYPDHASANDPKPAARSSPLSGAAQALYGDGDKVARPIDGASPLGGEAKPTLLSEPPKAQQQAARTEPFNAARLQVEGLQADPGLMSEFGTAAKELGLDHAGAERLVQLHAKAQRQSDAAMQRQSETWQQETLRTVPAHELQSVKQLLRDNSLTDPALREWLETSPAGNWAPLVKTLAKWAREMGRVLAVARYRLTAPHYVTRSNGVPAYLEAGAEIDSFEMMPGWEPTPLMDPLDAEAEAAFCAVVRRLLAAGPQITGIGHGRDLWNGQRLLDEAGWGDKS